MMTVQTRCMKCENRVMHEECELWVKVRPNRWRNPAADDEEGGMIRHNPRLRWQTVGGSLDRLVTDIDAALWFTIEHKPGNPVDYRWELRIHQRNTAGPGVLLHSHPSRADAQAAAARHVGDE